MSAQNMPQILIINYISLFSFHNPALSYETLIVLNALCVFFKQ